MKTYPPIIKCGNGKWVIHRPFPQARFDDTGRYVSINIHEYILLFFIPIKLIHNIGIFLDPMKNIPFFIPKNVDG